MDKIKVVLFAMTGFGNRAFRALMEAPFVELMAVITPKGENKPFPHYKCRRLQEVVTDEGIALYEGLILKEESAHEFIKTLLPDLIVVSTFRQIIPKNIISIPRLGIINVHPSLLPKYRGPTPIYWVLANGEKKTGVTVHFIEDETVDSGRIITQLILDILPSDTDAVLRKRLAMLSEKALIKALRLILKKDRKKFPLQNETEATYYPKYTFVE